MLHPLRTLWVLNALLFPALPCFSQDEPQVPRSPRSEVRVVPGEYLVRLRPDADGPGIARQLEATIVERYDRIGWILLRRDVPGPVSPDPGFIGSLRGDPFVRDVEPNYVATLTGAATLTADDPGVPYQVYLDAIGAIEPTVVEGRIDPPVVVAVIDSGCFTHEDLEAALHLNPGELEGEVAPGVDDDGNGKLDDWRGWDFVDDDSDPRHGSDPDAYNDHGTAVAGFIGATTGNGIGIRGVAQHVSILNLRAFDEEGYGDVAHLLKAIEYAVDRGAEVVNCSWVVYADEDVDALKAEMRVAAADGVVFVVSSGNDGADLDLEGGLRAYPVNFDLPNIITVAATDPTGAIAPYSNHGDVSVDLAAPGSYNYGLRVTRTTTGGLDEDYGSVGSGTSFSAPLVSGALALLIAQDRDRAWEQNIALLLESARELPTDTEAGAEGPSVAHGLLDIGAAWGAGTASDSDVTPVPESDAVDF